MTRRRILFRAPCERVSSTNWTAYYSKPPGVAQLTRQYTSRVLRSCLKRFACAGDGRIGCIAELGGANSCFLASIIADFKPALYHVIDTNVLGLRLLTERSTKTLPRAVTHNHDVLGVPLRLQADVAFSVGLVEHFDPPNTKRAILAHFDVLHNGGYVIISFPTPTLLYRTARFIAEMLGLWMFPDERPLNRKEVLAAVSERGYLIFEQTLWPLIFTQHLMVFRSASH